MYTLKDGKVTYVAKGAPAEKPAPKAAEVTEKKKKTSKRSKK